MTWKGYLRLSLVSCPIALYPASSLSEKVSFMESLNMDRAAPVLIRVYKEERALEV